MMKKLIFILAMAYTILCPVISEIIANPIVSRGKPVYTSSGAAQYLVDDKFNTSSWNVTNGSWIAIHIDSGPSKVFVNWNDPVYAWSNELSPSKCPNTNPIIIDYDFLISSNSTNGVDGEWTIADSIRGNIVTARGHLIDFSGASWVKMKIIKGSGHIDEIEVFDASQGDSDVWFFAGTSITANAFKATPPSKNYADLVTMNYPDYNPAIIRGGIGCITSTDFVNNLSKYLKMAKNAHYWAIEMGTNDAWGGTNGNVSTFKNNMQLVIDSCKTYGIQPIIARMIATRESVAKWQVNPDFLKAIDDLTLQNNLIPGPDFYTWFLAHQTEINGGTDGVHPNATGAASMQRLWAQKMAPLYGGCASTDIIPYIKVNNGVLTLNSGASLTKGDTLTLSPQPSTGGSWLWNGPNGFSSTSREVVIDSIQTNQSGNYNATYTNTDSCLSTYTIKITVTSPPVIIKSNKFSNNFLIFPNPADGGKFRISVNDLSNVTQVCIYDILGKLAFNSILTKKETELNTGLNNGIYIVKIINGKNSLYQKLIVK